MQPKCPTESLSNSEPKPESGPFVYPVPHPFYEKNEENQCPNLNEGKFGWRCSRKKGHLGPHLACMESEGSFVGTLDGIWPNGEVVDFDHAYEPVSYFQCDAVNNKTKHTCTLTKGHLGDHWAHLSNGTAVSTFSTAATIMPESPKFQSIPYQNIPKINGPALAPVKGAICLKPSPAAKGICCTEKKDHSGPHIACGTHEVIAVWDNTYPEEQILSWKKGNFWPLDSHVAYLGTIVIDFCKHPGQDSNICQRPKGHTGPHACFASSRTLFGSPWPNVVTPLVFPTADPSIEEQVQALLRTKLSEIVDLLIYMRTVTDHCNKTASFFDSVITDTLKPALNEILKTLGIPESSATFEAYKTAYKPDTYYPLSWKSFKVLKEAKQK